MFGKYKLVIVEGADGFLSKYKEKLQEYIKASKGFSCLVLDVQSLDKRTKLVKALDNKLGIDEFVCQLYVVPMEMGHNDDVNVLRL